MRIAGIVTLIAIALTGCERERPVPDALHAPPFHLLRDVALGMTAADLTARRTLTFVPHAGYVEDISGYQVYYGFDADDESQPPHQRARLEAVTVTESDAAQDAALVRYTRSVLEATRMLGVTPQCRFHAPSRSMLTQYPLQAALYEVVYTPGELPAAGPAVSRSFRLEPLELWAAAQPQSCVR